MPRNTEEAEKLRAAYERLAALPPVKITHLSATEYHPAATYPVWVNNGVMSKGLPAVRGQLRDITDQIADQVEVRFADGSAPTVVQDAADSSALYVLMPMRV